MSGKTTTPIWAQGHWRLRNDDGTLATATFKAAEDTSASILVNQVFRLRMSWGESAAQTTATSSGAITLEYAVNAGAWTTVTGSSAAKTAASATVTDGTTETVQRLTLPTGVAAWAGPAEFDSNNSASARTPVDQGYEVEFGLMLDGAQLSGGESVTFRLLHGGAAFDTVDSTPTLSVQGKNYQDADLNSVGAGAATFDSGFSQVNQADLAASGVAAASFVSGATVSTELSSAGTASASFAGTSVSVSDLVAAGTGGATLHGSSIALSELNATGLATATFEDASSYPEAKRTGEVLGAELLFLEVLGDPSVGPVYFDADMSAAASASLTIATARVIPGAQSAQGAATVQLAASAIGTGTAAAAGSASLSLITARVVPAQAASAGATAATLNTATVKAAGASAVGAVTVTISAARVIPGVVASTGAAAVTITAARVLESGLSSAGAATVTLPAVRIRPGTVAPAGASALTINTGAVKAAGLSSASSGFANWLTTITRDSVMASSGLALLTLFSEALKDATISAAGTATVTLPADLIAEAVAAIEASSECQMVGIEVHVADVQAMSSAIALFGGLGRALRIEQQDMERGAEFRAMDRGPFDASMALSAETRMERGEERRSMEVTS